MDNPEKQATQTNKKTTTQYVLDTTMLELKRTEHRFLLLRKSYRTSQHETQNVKIHNRTTQKELKNEQHEPYPQNLG